MPLWQSEQSSVICTSNTTKVELRRHFAEKKKEQNHWSCSSVVAPTGIEPVFHA